jgi:hypothetical protein
MADRLALNVGGMDPIDEGPPLGFSQGAGRADNEHRRAIEIGVVDPIGACSSPTTSWTIAIIGWPLARA